MYACHSIKQMAGRGSGKNKCCETRGIVEEDKARATGRDLDRCGGVEDKMTKRAHKQKRRKLENDFTREGGRL